MSRRGWALFAAMSVIWGMPYLLIKIADGGVSAPVLVLARAFADHHQRGGGVAAPDHRLRGRALELQRAAVETGDGGAERLQAVGLGGQGLRLGDGG